MSDLEIEVHVTSTRMVRLPGIGGFPVENIGYWKTVQQVTDQGTVQALHVQFRSGGFIDLPDVDEATFASLVYGEPF